MGGVSKGILLRRRVKASVPPVLAPRRITSGCKFGILLSILRRGLAAGNRALLSEEPRISRNFLMIWS
jgi:hypothetical protein